MKRITTQTMKKLNITFVLLILLVSACGSKKDPYKMEKEELKAYIGKLTSRMNKVKDSVNALKAHFDTLGGVDPYTKLRLVETITLENATFEHFFEVQGSVTSEQNVTVSPEMSGVIVKRMVQEGQNVRKGQAIAQIDDEIIRQNIEEVEKRLEMAVELFNRQQNLYQKKIGSEIQFLQAKNNKESLEKSLETLNSQLSKSVVKSPISGVIDEFFVNKGEMGAAGMPIARIVNLNSVEVTCDVAENYLLDVKKGDEVTISFPSIDREVTTKVTTIGKFINPSNRTFKVTMKLDNSDGMLRPNTMAVVKIRDFIAEDAITAPKELIQRSTNGEEFVFMADTRGDDVFAMKTFVKTGMEYNGNALVTEGLTKQDKLISKGFNEVTHDTKVRLKKILPPSAGL